MPGLPPGMVLFDGSPEPPPEALPPGLGLEDDDCPDGDAPGEEGVPPGGLPGLPPGMLEGEGSPGKPPLGVLGVLLGLGMLGLGKGVTGAQAAAVSTTSSAVSVLKVAQRVVSCIPAPESMRASSASLCGCS